MVQLQEKHQLPTAKKKKAVNYGATSVLISRSHSTSQNASISTHFKWIHCAVTANGAEENMESQQRPAIISTKWSYI